MTRSARVSGSYPGIGGGSLGYRITVFRAGARAEITIIRPGYLFCSLRALMGPWHAKPGQRSAIWPLMFLEDLHFERASDRLVCLWR